MLWQLVKRVYTHTRTHGLETFDTSNNADDKLHLGGGVVVVWTIIYITTELVIESN